MKELSRVTSKEIMINPRYAIARFMNSKIAFKNKDDDKKVLFTIKKVKEEGIPEEIQFHIRIEGRDFWSNKPDIVDVDFYVDLKSNIVELSDIVTLTKPKQSEDVSMSDFIKK